ncbi:MAG: mandelate racemase/muconate lactonizing enzyme family protein [Devosia sp.]|uniref:mandelate racemase/muconate lactonizing enzyme family protein n=1 Tax=Devosia sp. 66-22 TaxID=1895753 RepID=UPI00092979AC|nr:mandelate racemase/muconate lactonizing enzyme family protein [Devosia sp. 66-22]MBN9345368.1 mandelate racemase/muconate lactonizing enzyme family protein [Devosia sp.]OJX50743.1 MAG: mandelate racemase [Devosia sp. 66-22]
MPLAPRDNIGPVRITRIVAAPLFGESPKGGWSVEIKAEDSIHALIAVHTDAGITGYGSVFTDGRLVEAALDVLEPYYRGENALEPERVSEKMHQNTFWMGRGGTLTHAVSGIDIALWDILGKVTGLSVGRLMGGRHRERVMPYCSLLMEEPAQMGDEIVRWREQGFRAFKIGWGPFGRRDDYRNDEAIVRAAKDALPPGGRLMVDAGASDAYWPNGLKWALRTADMLADHDVDWFEEAVKPDALEDFITLRRESRVPISGGEVLTRRQSFIPFITQGAFDIVQPDVTKVGGLSEQRRIAWLAQDFGVRYVGHGWNTALGIAADLQLSSALPNVDLVEYIAGSAYVDNIMATPFKLDAEGMLAVPDTPGLGVALDPDRVARYTPDAKALF